ncbi:hypothetical protein QP888_04425 [Corynebacterium sp. MSK297]|uniref:hypothetical protein n=1 Tax=Corynebacterium sp. MSK297 TaxID=3050221 RepID=UPI00254E00A6|nr:hypothetical protein [Corynebacterium sp. MSK297]MDK8845769.1 hypothetical protein [Corynebacterium sp. MSK297]
MNCAVNRPGKAGRSWFSLRHADELGGQHGDAEKEVAPIDGEEPFDLNPAIAKKRGAVLITAFAGRNPEMSATNKKNAS